MRWTQEHRYAGHTIDSSMNYRWWSRKWRYTFKCDQGDWQGWLQAREKDGVQNGGWDVDEAHFRTIDPEYKVPK